MISRGTERKKERKTNTYRNAPREDEHPENNAKDARNNALLRFCDTCDMLPLLLLLFIGIQPEVGMLRSVELSLRLVAYLAATQLEVGKDQRLCRSTERCRLTLQHCFLIWRVVKAASARAACVDGKDRDLFEAREVRLHCRRERGDSTWKSPDRQCFPAERRQ